MSSSAPAQIFANKFVSLFLTSDLSCFFPFLKERVIDLKQFQDIVVPENIVAGLLSQNKRSQDLGNIALLTIPYQTDMNEHAKECPSLGSLPVGYDLQK